MTTAFFRRVLRWAIRSLVALIFLLPLLWILTAALHPLGRPLPQRLWLLPVGLDTGNFWRIWQLLPLGHFTLNSLLVVLLAVPLTLLVASWAGYGMARLPLSSQRWLLAISVAVLMVPSLALWMPRFLIYKQLGWLDSIWALIAPVWMGTSPLYVLLFYRAFRRIPAELYDAARVDGAGVVQTWAVIGLPLVRPTVVGVGVLSGVFYWGDFLSPLLYLRSERWTTLPVALQLLGQLSRSDWPLLMAGAVFVAAIPIGLFVLCQRFIVSSQ